MLKIIPLVHHETIDRYLWSNSVSLDISKKKAIFSIRVFFTPKCCDIVPVCIKKCVRLQFPVLIGTFRYLNNGKLKEVFAKNDT